MPKVSVIIPAFNADRYIRRALGSVSAQTERDLEVLVVDDCSTDATASVVELASREDGRIRLLRTRENGGPSAARNVGLRAARGQWIALLDADDAMAPQRLSFLIALAEEKGADLAADNILLEREGGDAPSAPMIPSALLSEPQRLGFAAFVEGNIGDPRHPRFSYGFLKPILSRAFLERHSISYDETVRFAEDFALYVRCLAKGAVWWITPEPFYLYLVRANSLTEVQTSGDLDRLRRRQRGLLQEPAVISDPRLTRAIRRHLVGIDRNYYYRAFTDALKARDVPQAVKIFFESPRSPALIVREGLRQAPIIAAKFRRGGYRSRSLGGPAAPTAQS